MVQGDTTSTLAAAFAAFHAQIPVAHVEAGLRSGTMALPFPEEMNRRVVSLIAAWHFAPTDSAAANLRAKEGRSEIVVTGNTVVDAVQVIMKVLDEVGDGKRPALPRRRTCWQPPTVASPGDAPIETDRSGASRRARCAT